MSEDGSYGFNAECFTYHSLERRRLLQLHICILTTTARNKYLSGGDNGNAFELRHGFKIYSAKFKVKQLTPGAQES